MPPFRPDPGRPVRRVARPRVLRHAALAANAAALRPQADAAPRGEGWIEAAREEGRCLLGEGLDAAVDAERQAVAGRLDGVEDLVVRGQLLADLVDPFVELALRTRVQRGK